MTQLLKTFLCLLATATMPMIPLATAQQPVPVTVNAFPEGFPYRAFNVKDALSRTVSFYLTDADAKDDRPLILVLQGSGCASNFMKQGERVGGSWHAFVRRANKRPCTNFAR